MQTGEISGGNNPPARNVPGEIDVRALTRAIWRNRFRILVPTIFVAVATFFLVGNMTPLFRSSASVLIESRDNIYTRPGGSDRLPEVNIDEQAIQSQVQVIMSRDLAKAVVEKMQLAKQPEFDPLLQGMSVPRWFMSMLGVTRDPRRMSEEERILSIYFNNLTVYPVGQSHVIAIEFSSSDPQLAANVANAVAEEYLVIQQRSKQSSTRQASSWLSTEIEDMRKRVAEAEGRVEDFRAKSNLFMGSNNATITTQQLGELSTQLASARTQQAEAQAKSDMIRELLRSGGVVESLDVANSELIRRLVEQRVTLRSQIARESRTLLPAHPRMKELSAQLTDLEEQIRQEARKLAMAYDNETKLASKRLESLQKALESQKKIAASANEQDVQLRALEREAKAQRDLLEQFLGRYREASARERDEAAPPDARIISQASASNTPYFPKTVPMTIVAALATCLIAIGLVTAGELMRAPAWEPYAPSGPHQPQPPYDGGPKPDGDKPSKAERAAETVYIVEPLKEPPPVSPSAVIVPPAPEKTDAAAEKTAAEEIWPEKPADLQNLFAPLDVAPATPVPPRAMVRRKPRTETSEPSVVPPVEVKKFVKAQAPKPAPMPAVELKPVKIEKVDAPPAPPVKKMFTPMPPKTVPVPVNAPLQLNPRDLIKESAPMVDKRRPFPPVPPVRPAMPNKSTKVTVSNKVMAAKKPTAAAAAGGFSVDSTLRRFLGGLGISVSKEAPPSYEEMDSYAAKPAPRRREAVPVPEISGALPIAGTLGDGPRRASRPPRALETEAAVVRLLDDVAARLADMPTHGEALTILVTGVNSAVDAGSVALTLSRSLANTNRKVVLLNAGTGSAALDDVSTPVDGSGLSDLMTGDATFSQAIHRDRGSAAHLIGEGNHHLDLAVRGDALDVIFDALQMTYDFVVVAAPDCRREGEMLNMARRCGASILVSPENGKGQPATAAAYDLLNAQGIDDIVLLLAAPSWKDAPRTVKGRRSAA